MPPNPWRNLPVVQKLAASSNPLARRSFLKLGAALSGGIAIGAGTASRRCSNRAMDETGYVLPTIAELRKQRGTNSVYHDNSIQTWQVKPNGSVFDVQLA